MQKIFGIIGWIGTVAGVRRAVAACRFSAYRPSIRLGSVRDLRARGPAWSAVLIYMAGQWRDVADFYKGRGARYGTMSIVSIVVFLGILVAVNYLGTRQNKRWDLTANQVYSLSDQTIKILKELKEPVKVTVFERNDRQDVHRDRLEEYQYQTTQLTTEYIDPDREPTRAGAAKIDTLPTILFEYQGRTERVTSTNEQDLTNALIKVGHRRGAQGVFHAGPRREGHRVDAIAPGYSTAVEAMKQDNFAFEQLVLIQQKTVPDDATIVVIAGPTTDFFPPEIEALNAYVAQGRQGDGAARSAAEGAGAAAADAVPGRLGHPRRQRRRPRRERHGADARHRRVGAGRGAVSAAPDHRGLPRHHGVSDGAIDDADRRRLERPHRAAAREHQRAELGRSRPRVARRPGRPRSRSTPTRATSRGRSRWAPRSRRRQP